MPDQTKPPGLPVVILAGGLGTRLAEHTDLKPKPMVEIGGRPILWHIMKHYGAHDCREFYVALGYKGQVIKRFFVDEIQLAGDLVVGTGDGRITNRDTPGDEWTVHLCETGEQTNTGGRLRRLKGDLRGKPFLLTYGDGVSDVPIDRLLAFHRAHGKMGTVTAVRPPARFGGLVFEGDMVREFTEKPQIGEGWINGGFMVLEPGIFDHLSSDNDSLESDLLEHLAEVGELAAYRHDGFWQCMDTVREVNLLNAHWESGSAPWKTWND
jgi:glucose-1-phosphate cytidylyltransferase